MDKIEAERLERIVRNAIPNPKLERVESEWGEIYFAHGLNFQGIPTGFWAVHGTANGPIEFTQESSTEGIRQELVNQAADYAKTLLDKGLLQRG